jgi:hypothetical protein
MAAAAHEAIGGAGVGSKQWRHRNIGRRPYLASEPHTRRRPDARKRRGFQSSRFRQLRLPTDHADAAGGSVNVS